jgi:hypothetical protein
MGLAGTNSGQYELSRDYTRSMIDRGTFDPGEDAGKLIAQIQASDKYYWDWELIVVTNQVTMARELDDARFQPGEITGQAFVWSYVDGRIRCTGPVIAHSSDTVMSLKVDRHLTNGKNGFLEQDLEEQAFAAAVTGLHDVAP